MNKKAQVSRTIILFGVLIFYSVMFVFYGAYGYTVSNLNNENQNTQNYISSDYETNLNTGTSDWDTTGYKKSGLKDLAKYVVAGFKETPDWLNIMLFIPLSILVGYLILVSFFPTANAGG